MVEQGEVDFKDKIHSLTNDNSRFIKHDVMPIDARYPLRDPIVAPNRHPSNKTSYLKSLCISKPAPLATAPTSADRCSVNRKRHFTSDNVQMENHTIDTVTSEKSFKKPIALKLVNQTSAGMVYSSSNSQIQNSVDFIKSNIISNAVHMENENHDKKPVSQDTTFKESIDLEQVECATSASPNLQLSNMLQSACNISVPGKARKIRDSTIESASITTQDIAFPKAKQIDQQKGIVDNDNTSSPICCLGKRAFKLINANTSSKSKFLPVENKQLKSSNLLKNVPPSNIMTIPSIQMRNLTKRTYYTNPNFIIKNEQTCSSSFSILKSPAKVSSALISVNSTSATTTSIYSTVTTATNVDSTAVTTIFASTCTPTTSIGSNDPTIMNTETTISNKKFCNINHRPKKINGMDQTKNKRVFCIRDIDSVYSNLNNKPEYIDRMDRPLAKDESEDESDELVVMPKET